MRSSTSLPSLAVGANNIVYRDETIGDRAVRITHGWEESSANRPPAAPPAPSSPAAGGKVDVGAPGRFAWESATDPDGHKIVDYHVQVSPRDDFAYPLSPNFDRLTDSGDPRWQVPEGWLVPGRTYFWRVRAVDEQGAWSNWSQPWQFIVVGGE